MFAEQSPSVRGPAINDAVNMDIVVTANVTTAIGQVVALNALSTSGAGVTAAGWAPETMSCALAVAGNCEANTRKLMAVALEPAAAGAKVRVRVRGVCQALMTASMTDVTYGTGGLTVGATAGSLTNNAAGSAGQADTQIAVAIPLEATGTAAALKFVMFDGLYGFGGIPEAV
jgi:hypothetical protein